MRNPVLPILIASSFASGCFIVTDDKPVNSAPTSTAATSSATAAPTTPPPRPKLRRAPPQAMPDGGF